MALLIYTYEIKMCRYTYTLHVEKNLKICTVIYFKSVGKNIESKLQKCLNIKNKNTFMFSHEYIENTNMIILF